MRIPCAVGLLAVLASSGRATAAGRSPAAHHHHQPAPSPRKTPAGGADSVSRIAAASPLLRRLTPVDSGPGVVVCEPIPHGADKDVANFGNGCARWLNLIVGGQGEFGKTPLWGYTIYTLARMRRPDMRLDPAAASHFSHLLGLTHLYLGQIEGDASHCTLSYRLWDAGTRKAVGPTHALTGSEMAVTAGLPRLAAALAAGLGVPAPRVPSAVGETPVELQWLGRLPWGTFTLLPPEDMQTLHDLALLALPGTPESRPHPPFLAAFLDLIWYGTAIDIGHVMTATRALTSALPDNTLVLAQVGERAVETGRANSMDLPLAAVLKNLRRYPRSALCHLVRSDFAVVDGQLDVARAEAEWVVRCAPRNPTAWWDLGKRIFAQADAIRHGRFVTQLTAQQMAYCGARYDEYLPVTIQAAFLDPTARDAWRDVSVAAAFDGQDRVADNAFWRALDLAPTDYDTLWWGAQLYQPKWLDDPAKLTRVARQAAFAGANWSAQQRVAIAVQICFGGLPKPALAILRNDQERKALQDEIHQYDQYRKAHPDQELPPPPEDEPALPAASHQSA